MDMQTLFSLEGQVALVTGGAYGIGFAIAEALAGAGAKIAFNCRTQANLDKALEDYAAKGIAAKGYIADVTDEAQVADLDGDGQGEAWEFYNHGDTGWSFYDRDSEGRYWRYFLTAGPEAPLGTADSEKGFVPADPEGNPLLGEDGNPLGPYVLEDGALRLRMGE